MPGTKDDMPTKANRFREHFLVWLTLSLAVVVGSLATVLQYLGTSPSDGSRVSQPVAPSSSGSAAVAAVPTRETRSLTPAAVSDLTRSTVGECLDASHAVLPCDAAHVYQLYSEGSRCDSNTMLAFLGGQLPVDVLGDDVRPVALVVDDRPVCALASPVPGPLLANVQDVLASPGGDVWRKCYDSRVVKEVPCSVPHTDEAVYSGLPAGSAPLDCAARAETYIGTTLSSLGTALHVTATRQSATYECFVGVDSPNSLTASLRRLGTNSLPISSDQ